jgi:NADH-quinone oxidoreductase subunit L
MSLALILLFPILGFILNGILHLNSTRTGKKVSANAAGLIATLAMAATFLVVAYRTYLLHQLPADGRIFEETLFPWIYLGSLKLDFALRFDSLSSVFCMVITGVGTLIHLYSMGYMHDDETPAKYFAYLNLFCFMMLNLVLGSNLPLVFLGWEGVGLASYLLIGYWYTDPDKVAAGQKAFIMNRIGDLAFLIAMFIAFKFVGTLDLLGVQELANVKTSMLSSNGTPQVVTIFGLLIFFACTGKSAQIPLFTWLPDAMAGPTPVSALIHAATMVTSGIYLLTRLQGLISLSEVTLHTIAMIGALTAFVSALIACAQTDIKKVLAYSTVSQLGFMFLGCGVGAFDAGVFHVMTHAFFKALMFLGAGSVIHALSGEQNIFKMGGLRSKLPITSATFIIGWAAILGLPPFSGFFSKDEIIYQSLVSPNGSPILFAIAVASAFLTAFYMTRLIVLVFFGKSRTDSAVAKKIHESPYVMTIPLIILAALSLGGGWFGAPFHSEHAEMAHSNTEYIVMVASVLLAVIAALLGYQKFKNTESKTGENKGLIFVEHGFGIDAFYMKIAAGFNQLAEGTQNFIEEFLVQRLMRWTTAAVDLSGNLLKAVQVGSSQVYLTMMVLAIFGIMAWIFYGVGQYGKL